MIKLYCSTILLLIISFQSNAQHYLSSHLQSYFNTPNQSGLGLVYYDGINCYTGNNEYEDQGVIQLFDASTEFPEDHLITGIMAHLAYIDIIGDDSTFQIAIYHNEQGELGELIDIATVSLTGIDTNIANATKLYNGDVITELYNVHGTFNSPIQIPQDGFIAAIMYPTNGSTIYVTSTLHDEAPYANSQTNSGTINSVGTIDRFAGADIAAVLIPVLESTASIKFPVSNNSFQVYPNPAYDNITIAFNTNEFVSIEMISIDGRIVMSKAINSLTQKIDVKDLTDGVYILQGLDKDGNVIAAKKITKK